MKILHRIVCLMSLAALAATPASAVPLGTGFTYQGQLNQNGSPVNGTAHLRFTLMNAAVGGSPIGASEIQANVPVTNGLFTVQLNSGAAFGPNAFNGDARWLQVEVCSDASCSGSPILLTPRQPVTAAPYARFSAAPWQLSGSNLSYTNGNVGIGTSNPHTKLELQSGFGTEVLRFGYSDSDYHFLSTGFHGVQPYLNYLGFSIEHGSNDIRRVMTLQGDGNVGIGTPNPTQKLQVLGNIFLGPNGEYAAPACEENLRILRGIVNSSGTPTDGCCFTVSHPLTGTYDITFNTPFAGAQYDIGWFTIDGGGAGSTSGGSYSLGGTIGQPDAGVLSGGSYSLVGGFWGRGGAVVGIDDVDGWVAGIPLSFRFHAPVPNPLVQRTVIAFELAEARSTRLLLYDAAGRLVRTLAEGPMPAGRYERVWDGRNDRGRPVAAGIYFLRLDAGRVQMGNRVVVLR